jgi:two-component system cell cycle response regulator
MDKERIRVLLIEEDEQDAQRVQHLLGAPEWSPFALTWQAALESGVRHLAEDAADVILLGLSVPGALAAKTVDSVQAHAAGVPVIILTSLDETAVLLDTARGGAVDCLVKTRLNARELSRAIRYAVEHRRTTEARRRAEASLREVVSSSADAMVVADGAGTVRFANPAAELLFGTGAEDLVNKPFAFPLQPGQTNEVEIPREGETRIAEMRVVTTEWEGEPARLATLRDITASVRMREELRALSLRDDLTGLYNRRGFATLAQQQLKLADRNAGSLLLVFADVDGMKAINDKLGHSEGDRALRTTAEVLTASFRDCDIVARVGGDEFAVLAIGARAATRDTISSRIQDAVNSRLARERLPYKLSLSLGCVQYDAAQPCTLEELLARADQAMYDQKRDRGRS